MRKAERERLVIFYLIDYLSSIKVRRDARDVAREIRERNFLIRGFIGLKKMRAITTMNKSSARSYLMLDPDRIYKFYVIKSAARILTSNYANNSIW